MGDANDRLKQARERAGFKSAPAAARKLGMAPSTYASHENGQTPPPPDNVRRYARLFKVSAAWILTGEGPMAAQNIVKLMGRIGAGGDIDPEYEQIPEGGLEEIELPINVGVDAIAFEVSGTSMKPRYDAGVLIVCTKSGRDPEGLIGLEVAVRTSDNKRYLKILRAGRRRGYFTLESFNSDPIADVRLALGRRDFSRHPGQPPCRSVLTTKAGQLTKPACQRGEVMRQFLAAGVATLAIFHGPALAGVSDDLVFCSKLTNSRERIACYDAAARIAANVGRSTSEPVTMPMATAPAAAKGLPYKVTAPAERTPFHGPFIALGGGYGLAGPIAYGFFDSVSSLVGTAHPSGASALAAAGYNLQLGHFVVGLELSGRFWGEQFSDSKTGSVDGGPTGVIGTSFKSYQYKTDAAAHLGIRAGLAVDNTMIYGKVGFGAAEVAQANQTLTIGSFCSHLLFSNTVTCLSRSPLPTGGIVGTSAWHPSLMLAGGLEQNIGPFFARIEGQAEAIRGPSIPNEWLWTMRAVGALGYRF